MKRFLRILGAGLFAFVFFAADLTAGATGTGDWQDFFGVAGLRTQSRNAADGTIDAAYYNPAGLVSVDKGLYIDIGSRFVYTDQVSEKGGEVIDLGVAQITSTNDAESSFFTLIAPNAAVVYNTGSAAVFYTFDIRAGGGGGKWRDVDLTDGTSEYKGVDVDIFTYTAGHTLGGAFELNEKVKVSSGIRFLHRHDIATIKNPEIEDTIEGLLTMVGYTGIEPDTLTDAMYTGYGSFIGAMVTPVPGLNIAAQFQSKVMLEGECDGLLGILGSLDNVLAGTGEVERGLMRETLPSVLYLGIGYRIPGMETLEIMFSYTRSFNGDTNYKKPFQKFMHYVTSNFGGDYEYDELTGSYYVKGDSDTQVFGLGAEWQLNDMILVSAGINYSNSGAQKHDYIIDPDWNQMRAGFGSRLTLMPELDVEFGFEYSNSSFEGKTIDHHRHMYQLGWGVTWKAI